MSIAGPCFSLGICCGVKRAALLLDAGAERGAARRGGPGSLPTEGRFTAISEAILRVSGREAAMKGPRRMPKGSSFRDGAAPVWGYALYQLLVCYFARG